MRIAIYLFYRWDMSKSSADVTAMARSLASMHTCASLPSSRPAKQRLGSKCPPLLQVEPDHVVPDELHLLLRITDVLLRNLIWEMVRCDHSARAQRGSHTNHLQQLIDAITSCGVTFKAGKIILVQYMQLCTLMISTKYNVL